MLAASSNTIISGEPWLDLEGPAVCPWRTQEFSLTDLFLRLSYFVYVVGLSIINFYSLFVYAMLWTAHRLSGIDFKNRTEFG